MLRQVKPNGEYKELDDNIAYFEMARIAMTTIPVTIAEKMDLSDDEFVRLRQQLQKDMEM
tara:strand:- start:1002 stop:1181 length:180 start_codon:yes stop_codon:yes gene_type:complete